jgi:hypothetical protein
MQVNEAGTFYITDKPACPIFLEIDQAIPCAPERQFV